MSLLDNDGLSHLVSIIKSNLDSKSDKTHTHNYAGSSSAGGSATSANKLATARTIALGTGVTGTATNFDGSGNITIPVTEIKESYLSWGGKNINGGVSPIGASLSSEHSANRLAYLNPNAITVEYSNDAGSTWTDAGLSNSTKIGFVTTSGGFSVGSASTVTINHRTRVTLTAQDGTTGYVYTRPRKMLLNVSTNGHSISVTVEAKTGASGASWTTLGTYSVSGWSGWNDIPLNIGTFGGNKTQTDNYWYIRLTFAITTVASSYTTSKPMIIGMRLFGDTCWTKTSNMGETGHLYSYDTNQNATFPAGVTATTFTGALSGNASTATKLGTSAGSGTQPVYFSDGKPVATTYALHKTVPSDAKFTDTTYNTGTASTAGITKLYTGTGTATDGTMTQAAIKSALDSKATSSHGNHVPAIETANNAKFLRNDNTWQIVTPANIGAATSSHTHEEITELKNAIDAFVEISQSEIVEMFDNVTL